MTEIKEELKESKEEIKKKDVKKKTSNKKSKMSINIVEPELCGSWVSFINPSTKVRGIKCSNCGFGTLVYREVCPKCGSNNKL